MEIDEFETTMRKEYERVKHKVNPQTIEWDNSIYSVEDLILYSKKFKQQTASLESFSLVSYLTEGKVDLFSFAKEIQAVEDADTSYPILLAPDGYLLDGRHRLAKIVYNGGDEVIYKRLTSMPTHIREVE